MKRLLEILSAFALIVCAASCGKTAVSGTIDGAETLIVKSFDGSRLQTLDTLKTRSGSFRFSPKVEKGQPSFYYLYRGDRKLVSLLLKQGDRVSVQGDTLGHCTVEGSPESLELMQTETDYAAFIQRVNQTLGTGLSDADASREVSRLYVEYYRDRVSYVMNHIHSMTVIPVLSQQVNPDLPVFSQPTDAILFRTVADSLKTIYPDSRYVQQLEKEAQRRQSLMSLHSMVSGAGTVGYPDIELPGVDAQMRKLSDSLGKLTMVYFWASTQEQKMFNQDALLPLYEEFHGKGFEIYAVSLDVDKATWAAAVRNQQLPWINVCDARGIESPLMVTYALTNLPMAYFIVDGEIDTEARVSDGESLRNYLKKKL